MDELPRYTRQRQRQDKDKIRQTKGVYCYVLKWAVWRRRRRPGSRPRHETETEIENKETKIEGRRWRQRERNKDRKREGQADRSEIGQTRVKLIFAPREVDLDRITTGLKSPVVSLKERCPDNNDAFVVGRAKADKQDNARPRPDRATQHNTTQCTTWQYSDRPFKTRQHSKRHHKTYPRSIYPLLCLPWKDALMMKTRSS